MCGANITIMDSDMHPIGADDRAARRQLGSSPVMICNNVWLGMNVVVLKRMRIGERMVVCAGSVVTKDIPAGVIAGSIPSKVIRKIGQKNHRS